VSRLMEKKAKREAEAADLRERQTARGLVTHAREFHKAAQLIADQVGTDDVTDGLKDSAYHNPFYYLCGHSLELSMKATLLAAGRTHDELRWPIGHDLDRCLSDMRKHYPGHNCDEHADMIALLNRSYLEKEFEYRMTGARRWPHVFPLLYVVDEFCRWADAIVWEADKKKPPPK
jgi:hypothetical protein